MLDKQEQPTLQNSKCRTRYSDYPYCLYNNIPQSLGLGPLPGRIRVVKRHAPTINPNETLI